MKMKILMGIVVLGLIGSFSAISRIISDNNVYGPVTCHVCTVSRPMPDPGSRAFMKQWIVVKRRENFSFRVGAGGRFVLCNATACTTYERTDSGDWLGIAQEPITPPPSRGGGRGGGGGGGGGVGSGGSVTVKAPIPVKKQHN